MDHNSATSGNRPVPTLTTSTSTLDESAPYVPAEMNRLQLSWRRATVLLAAVFLFCNWGLVNGSTAPNWDAWYFYTPQFTLVADNARAGRFLLWDPWEQAGSPDHADPQVGAASPIMIATGAITGGTETGFRIYWLIIWFLGPVGILLLARHLKTPPWAALVVALGYAFCGFFTGHAEHTTFVYSFSFLPFIFWRFDVAMQSVRLWPAVETGAVWGLSALGGYPSLTVMTGGFLILWALGRCCTAAPGDGHMTGHRPPWKIFVFAAVALATTFTVGVIVLAPTYTAFFTEGTGYSERAGVLSRGLAVSGGQMAPGSLLNFASPFLILLKYPGNMNKYLWPDADLSLMALYSGALPLILALFAVVVRPRSGWRWWLVGTVAFALACAVGSHLPFRGWLYDYCPPTRFFRHVGAFRAYAILGVMVLALLAGRDLRVAMRSSFNSAWVKLFCVAAVVSTAAIGSYFYVIGRATQLPDHVHRSSRHLFGVWLAYAGVSLLFLSFRRTRAWLPLFLVIIAVSDAQLTRKISDPLISGGKWSRSTWVKLDAQHRASLDLTSNGLARELNPPSWIGNAGHNNNLPLKIPSFYNDPVMRNRFHLDLAKHPIVLNMGLGSDRTWFSEDVATVSPSDIAYSSFVKRSESIGAPVVVVHPRTEMREITHADLFIGRTKARTAQEAAEVSAISQLHPAMRVATKVLRYTPNHFDLAVFCPADGWLLVTDRWASGWHAKVNGQIAEVYGGDFIFRAVRVHEGENQIQFYYQQTLYFILLALSWSTLAIVLLARPVARLTGTDLRHKF